MNPEQMNAPIPPPPSGNPYEFITTPGKPPKPHSSVLPSDNPFVMKLVLIIGGAVVLIIVLTLVVNLLFGSKTNVDDLVALTQTQQEIVRVTTTNTQLATDPTIAGASTSTHLTAATQQQALLAYLKTHKRTVGAKELDIKKDTATDKQLTQAQATSTFDSTYTSVMRQELEAYSASLKTAYDKSASKAGKTLLGTDYTQVQLLLKQWPASQ